MYAPAPSFHGRAPEAQVKVEPVLQIRDGKQKSAEERAVGAIRAACSVKRSEEKKMSWLSKKRAEKK